ncbi:MAG: preprotein translocase subunit YajC [Pirellulales bacterium]
MNLFAEWGIATVENLHGDALICMPLGGLLLLAQEAESGGLMSMMPALIVIMGLFYFLILRPQKNKEQTFRTMIDTLKEKDRIVTIGGIHGVVTNVQRDSEIITVRIDESSGAKIRIGTSAIARVVTDEDKK